MLEFIEQRTQPMIYSTQSSKVELPDSLAEAGPADHPLRSVLAGELHARPMGAVSTPQRCSHLAMLSGEGDFLLNFAGVMALHHPGQPSISVPISVPSV